MRSDTIKKGYDKAPHRSLLRATGVKEEDFAKPFIAIVNSYVDIVPGHVHLQDFGKLVKDAVRAAGGVPFEFNTIGVDDGIAMGHAGMKYSLPSRELIADSVETMVSPYALYLTADTYHVNDGWVSIIEEEDTISGGLFFTGSLEGSSLTAVDVTCIFKSVPLNP